MLPVSSKGGQSAAGGMRVGKNTKRESQIRSVPLGRQPAFDINYDKLIRRRYEGYEGYSNDAQTVHVRFIAGTTLLHAKPVGWARPARATTVAELYS